MYDDMIKGLCVQQTPSWSLRNSETVNTKCRPKVMVDMRKYTSRSDNFGKQPRCSQNKAIGPRAKYIPPNVERETVRGKERFLCWRIPENGVCSHRTVDQVPQRVIKLLNRFEESGNTDTFFLPGEYLGRKGNLSSDTARGRSQQLDWTQLHRCSPVFLRYVSHDASL